MRFRLLTSYLLLVLFPSFSSGNVYSQETIGPACGSAVIDGQIGSTEWSSASTKTFQIVGSQGSMTATLRVMNSKRHLYLGMTIDDDEFSTSGEFLPGGDEFIFKFDNKQSGDIKALDSDLLHVFAGQPQFQDAYIYNITGSNEDDTLGGGTSDGIGFSSRQGSLNHFELRHPLCSGDPLDFCLAPGNSVGFVLEYLDAQADGSFGGNYQYPEFSDPQVLAQIVIGDCTTYEFHLFLPVIEK